MVRFWLNFDQLRAGILKQNILCNDTDLFMLHVSIKNANKSKQISLGQTVPLMGTASANTAKFRGIRLQMYIEDLLL